MARVQIENLPDPQPLQRLQRDVDTFTGAPRPVIDNDAERLSSALAGFSTALSHWGATMSKQTNISPTIRQFQDLPDPREKVRLAASGKYAQRGNKEADDWAGTQAAHALHDTVMTDIEAEMAKGLYRPTDPIADYQDRVNRHLQQVRDTSPTLYNNEAFNKAAAEAGNSARKKFQDRWATYQAGEREHNQQRTVQDFAGAVVQVASQPNATDEQIATSLAQAKDSLHAKYGFDYRRMDNIMFGAYKQMADKAPDAVERILLMDRGMTKDGIKLGRIIDNVDGVEANQLRDTIQRARERNFNDTAERTAIDTAKKALAKGDGSFQALSDTAYKNPFSMRPTQEQYIRAGAVREKALSEWTADEADRLQRQGFSGDEAAKRLFEGQVQTYVGSNVANPTWAAEMSYAGTVLGNPAQATHPDNVARLVRAKAVYDQLDRYNPGYVRETLKVSDRAETLFQIADTLHKAQVGQTPEGAMQLAVQYITAPNKVELNGEAKKAIDQGINEVWFGTNSWLSNKIDPAMPKDPALLAEHRKLASSLATIANLPPAEAVKRSAEVISSRLVNVNGRPYFNDPHITRDTAPAWERVIADTVASDTNGALRTGPSAARITNSSKLYLRRLGQEGVYALHAEDGMPVMRSVVGPNGEQDWQPVRFTAADVKTTQALIRTESEKKIAAENDQKRAAKVLSPLNRNSTKPPAPAEVDQAKRLYNEGQQTLDQLNGLEPGRREVPYIPNDPRNPYIGPDRSR